MTFRIEEEIGTIRSQKRKMTSTEYIEAAMRTSGDLTQREMLTNGALGLCGESGEVADLVKKWLFQGHKLDTIELHKEIGDVLWYIAILCKATGTDFETLMHMNIDKLFQRYPEKFEVERSVNREGK